MGRNQYWAERVYDLCVYYMTGNEDSTESVFMEKPGIEPATPGLQGIALIHYTTGASLNMHLTRSSCLFVAVFLGCTSTGRVGLGFLWFYVQELPKAQPAVVLVLKRLRRQGNGLKSHPTDWEKPEIEPATPGLQDIGLSPTPRRLLDKVKLTLFNVIMLF